MGGQFHTVTYQFREKLTFEIMCEHCAKKIHFGMSTLLQLLSYLASYCIEILFSKSPILILNSKFSENVPSLLNIHFWWVGVLCFLSAWITDSQGILKSQHWVGKN